ncbi:MAG: heavy metal translocating P-type ATPase [Acidobacteria bacterium]|nr:heavy metal translocating P-type ATPase [Acidobacteriota bacterium]
MAAATELLCDLCGLDCGQQPYRQAAHHFCCLGCMNVYSILEESGVLSTGVDLRETDLFRKSLELGLISTGSGVSRRTPPSAGNAPSDQAGAVTEERLFHLSGLWCSACSWLIEHTLTKQPGVESAEVYFVSDLLKLRYHPQYFPHTRVAELLAPLGYKASEYTPDRSVADEERKDLLMRLGVAAFLWVNVMGLNLSVYLGAFDNMPAAVRPYLPFVVMLLTLPVLLYSARPVFRLAWVGLKNGSLRMESLLSLGILAAFSYSAVESFRGGIHIYFDICCAITALVLIGKVIEQGAKHRAAKTIASLHRMLPSKVRFWEDGKERFVPVDLLLANHRFLVKAGERIPADGVIVEGASDADESLLTGESEPVAKRVGDTVVAGSLNLSGVLHVRATTVGAGSTIAQIVAAVERTLASRSELERKVDRVSRVFVPSVMVFALAVSAYWMLSGIPALEALLRSVTILVIACPCALGIGAPLALTAAVGAASRRGILLRDMQVLQSLRSLTTVVLDKTGTITEDQFALLEYPAEHLPLLASLEAVSEHPLGLAVVRRAREAGVELREPRDVVVDKGTGISGVVDDRQVRIGNRRAFGCIPQELEPLAAEHEANRRTVAFYSLDGVVTGLLVFGSRLRPGARATVDGLRRRGLDVLLVSGDSEATTAAVAREMGIGKYYAGTAPAEKVRIVAELKRAGGSVAMIGDGINDAPALAQADLGIAMGSGADLAMHSASIVLLSTQLTRVLDAIDLSHRTVSVIRQNLFWAFFYNTVGIAFAAAGLLNPLIAAGAMVVSSLSVIGNSYRLSRTKGGTKSILADQRMALFG